MCGITIGVVRISLTLQRKMIKDIIQYNKKEYKLSTIFIEKIKLFETMIFPIENGIISNNEVYCFRTANVNESKYKYVDICENVEKYLSDKAIEKYLACKDCHEWCCTMCKYFE